MRSILNLARSATRLPRSDLRAAGVAVGWVALMALALRVMPYARVRALVRRLPPAARPDVSAERCARALGRAARVVPRAGCLTRALAAECMLTRAGLPSVLTIGVRMDERRRLQAHAWIESDGIAVAGAAEAFDYQSLRSGARL